MLRVLILALFFPALSLAEGLAPMFRTAEEGGARRWAVSTVTTLRAAASPDAALLARLEAGTWLENLGCLSAQGRLWCKLRPLGGGRSGFLPADAMTPVTGPDGAVPTGPDISARRARAGDFDWSGTAPCAQERGQALGRCAIAVARGGGGDATVIATFANGFARRLSFAGGRFIRADATMSGTGRDMDWRIEGDTFQIRVDDQRFLLLGKDIFGP